MGKEFIMVFLLRWLKRSGLVILALLVIYAIARPTQIWLDGLYSGVRAPYLQMMSSNAVTIRWQSESKFSGVIRYGVKAEQLNKVQRESITGEVHEIRFTGLKPSTKYFYSAGDGDKSEL